MKSRIREGAPSRIPLTGLDPRLVRLHEWWDELRGEAGLPPARAIDPLSFRWALGLITLIEVEAAPLRFRAKLIGSDVDLRLPSLSRKGYIDEITDPAARSLLLNRYRKVVADATASWDKRQVEIAGLVRSYDALWLPFAADDGGRVAEIMAVLVFTDPR